MGCNFRTSYPPNFRTSYPEGSETKPVFCEESRMPWKTETMNDVRKEFALKALAAGAYLSALCREYGVTRKPIRQRISVGGAPARHRFSK